MKPGEHAVKVKNLRLLHVSQVEKISPQEQAAVLAEKAAKMTADKLPAVASQRNACTQARQQGGAKTNKRPPLPQLTCSYTDSPSSSGASAPRFLFEATWGSIHSCSF